MVTPPQRLGTGVPSAETGFPSPWAEFDAAAETPATEADSTQPTGGAIPLITNDTPLDTTPTGAAASPRGEWKWDKYPSHTACLKNPSYHRVEQTFVRVFDLSVTEECAFYAELVDANRTQALTRKTGLKNRVRFKNNPTMFPPDPGKTNVRVLVIWDVFEFVRLDALTGHPLV